MPTRLRLANLAQAHKVRTKAEVAQVLAQDVCWGGHSGYFADPDEDLGEIAWTPYFWNK